MTKINNKIQCFSIAELIFAINEEDLMNGKDIDEIQKRFSSIIKSFIGNENIEYSAGSTSKGSGTKLPFTTLTAFGVIDEHLILHFAMSFDKPVMFIIDTEKRVAKNYIDMNNAKNILNDKIFKMMKTELEYPKVMTRLFAKIDNFDHVIEKYMNKLSEYEDELSITGRNCFEVELDDLNR